MQPERPTGLVRARFCAFAEKAPGFLRRTLHPKHPDSTRPEAEVLRELRDASSRFKYVRLKILDERVEGDTGTVLFLAEIYRSGKEHSFIERSEFERVGGGWRYLRGEGEAAAADTAPMWSLETWGAR